MGDNIPQFVCVSPFRETLHLYFISDIYTSIGAHKKWIRKYAIMLSQQNAQK